MSSRDSHVRVSTDIDITLTSAEQKVLLGLAGFVADELKHAGHGQTRIPGLLNALEQAKFCTLTFSAQTVLDEYWNLRLNKAQSKQ